MEYPPIVTGNEDRRSTVPAESRAKARTGSRTDAAVLAEPVRPAAFRRGPDPAVVVGIAICVAIGALVVKPWSWVGQLGPGAAVATPLAGGGPAAGATASPPPTALLENLDPIEPATWSRISESLRLIDRDAVVFVARLPGGLDWRFVPVTPGARVSLAEAPATTGGDAVVPTDTVPMTGYLATPVAIGLARPSGEPAPDVLAWQILGPGASLRLPLRHPVGDLDRFLFLGPGLGLPRGEQRNRREISRFPPMWLPGVYRFDLTIAPGETRYVFIVLEPGDSG